jgi:hypothetical protein
VAKDGVEFFQHLGRDAGRMARSFHNIMADAMGAPFSPAWRTVLADVLRTPY